MCDVGNEYSQLTAAGIRNYRERSERVAGTRPSREAAAAGNNEVRARDSTKGIQRILGSNNKQCTTCAAKYIFPGFIRLSRHLGN